MLVEHVISYDGSYEGSYEDSYEGSYDTVWLVMLATRDLVRRFVRRCVRHKVTYEMQQSKLYDREPRRSSRKGRVRTADWLLTEKRLAKLTASYDHIAGQADNNDGKEGDNVMV